MGKTTPELDTASSTEAASIESPNATPINQQINEWIAALNDGIGKAHGFTIPQISTEEIVPESVLTCISSLIQVSFAFPDNQPQEPMPFVLSHISPEAADVIRKILHPEVVSYADTPVSPSSDLELAAKLYMYGSS